MRHATASTFAFLGVALLGFAVVASSAVARAEVGAVAPDAADSEPEAGAGLESAALFEVDERVVDGWRFVATVRHPEFIRLTFRDLSGDSAGVEVTLSSIAGATGGGYVVQPAPGMRAPIELLDAVERRLAEVEETAPAVVWQVGSGEAQSGLRGRLIPGVTPLPAWPRALAIGVLLSALLLVFAARRRTERGPSLRRAGGRSLLVDAFALVAIVLALRWLVPAMPLAEDPLRDLRLAMDCATGHFCGLGPTASFARLEQGSLWPRSIGVLLSLDRPFDDLERAVLLLHALATLMLAKALRSTGMALAPTIALVVAWLIGMRAADTLDQLWNPALLPLTSVAFAILAVRALDECRPWSWAAAAAALAFVVEAHIVAALLVPVWIAAVAIRAARPVATVVGSLLITAAILAALSPWAVLLNTIALADRGLVPHAVALVLLLPSLGLAARRFGPSATLTAVGVVAAYAALLTALALALTHDATARYAAPVAALACLAAARWLRGVGTSRGVAVVSVALVAVGLFVLANGRIDPKSDRLMWRVADIDPVGAALRVEGNYSDLLASLHADDPSLLVQVAALTSPLDAPSTEDRRTLTVLRHSGPPPTSIGDSWRAFSLPHGHGMLVRRSNAWVARLPFEVCAPRDGEDGHSDGCRAFAPASRGSGPLDSTRPYALRDGQMAAVSPDHAAPTRFRFTVTPGGDATERVLRLFQPTSGTCRPLFVSVEGVRYTGDLPSTQVMIHGGSGPGSVTVDVHAAGCRRYEAMPPSWVERAPDEEWIDALMSRMGW